MRPLRLEPRDVLAGVSVAVVLVPQSLAYAQLAGMPAYRGLFAAAIPPLVAAPFASSPYLQPGPTAVSALLTYGALAPLAPLGGTRYIELGLLLALMVGVIRILVGLLHAGVLAYLMSQSLLTGFIPAAAILIVASQLPVVLGTHGAGRNELYGAGWALGHADYWRVDASVIAILAAGAVLVGRRIHQLFPGVLLVVVAAVLYGRFGSYGGPKIGPVKTAFPPLTTTLPWSSIAHLVVPALVIALLGFAEASSIARTFAALERKRWDADREFISQGIANLGAGLFGGFPVGASFSRSALNRLAGARTNASAMVTGLTVLALIPLGYLLAPMPRAVLAATVIVAVAPLIRLGGILEIGRLSRPQVTITLTAFVLTLILAPHIELAILAAIGVSVAIHLWRELRLDVNVSCVGDQLIAAPQGVLWFGNARVLQDRVIDFLATEPNATELSVYLDGLGRIDLSGALALRTLAEDARQAGLRVGITGAPRHANRVLERVIGADGGVMR